MKRMLFNAVNEEEIRVAIVDDQNLIYLDIETINKKQNKGNIYKGIITRIEPSLEACFVDYGEERHGFLPFKEISNIFLDNKINPEEFKIQNILKEGQHIIVQIEKDERGNKGAFLTTFISLASRYIVLMPNNSRKFCISRRIESNDRRELKKNMESLKVPSGMSIIARTAGIGRSIEELKWNLFYLVQMWYEIEKASKKNHAPFMIYLESSLVIRSIRDNFSPEINEILIDSDNIFNQVKEFINMINPESINCVKKYIDDIPLFYRFQIEQQVETAYSRKVKLPSNGMIIIDHTEALVSIDVNSASSNKCSDIEETALNTNIEAVEEIAKQIRLRDLSGLIVIDFIDMENTNNQIIIEKKLRKSLYLDKARTQIGKISKFGLIELSRQRINSNLYDSSHIVCPRCKGNSIIRDIQSNSLYIIRIIQEESIKENTSSIHVQIPIEIATFILNEKRLEISKIELSMKVNVLLIPNKHLETPNYYIKRICYKEINSEKNQTSLKLLNRNIISNISDKNRKRINRIDSFKSNMNSLNYLTYLKIIKFDSFIHYIVSSFLSISLKYLINQ